MLANIVDLAKLDMPMSILVRALALMVTMAGSDLASLDRKLPTHGQKANRKSKTSVDLSNSLILLRFLISS